MFIDKIELKNIKKYDHIEVKLSEGLNFISGKNGAGKTTIIESIGYALFDYQASSKNFASYFIRKGEKKGTVKVWFKDKEGNSLISIRNIGMTSATNSWYIKKDEDEEDIAIVSGNNEVREYLKENLEFYPDDNITDIFKNIISVPQGEFTSAFLQTESTRKTIFDPIFRLETYKKAYENISMAKGIEKEVAEEKENVARMQGELTQLLSYQDDTEKKSSNLKVLRNEIEENEKKENDAKLEYKKANELKQKVEETSREIELKLIEIKKHKELIEIKKKDEESAISARKLIELNKESHDRYLALDKEIEKLESDKKEYEKIKIEFDDVEKRIEKGNVMISERDKTLNSYIEKAEADKSKIKDIENELIKLTELASNESQTKEESDSEAEYKKISDYYDKVSEITVTLSNMKKDLLKQLKKVATSGRELKLLKEVDDTIVDAKDEVSENMAIRFNKSRENIKVVSNYLVSLDDGEKNETNRMAEERENLTNELYKIYKICFGNEIEDADPEFIKEELKLKLDSMKDAKMNDALNRNTSERLKQQYTKQLDELKIELEKLKDTYKKENEEKAKWELALVGMSEKRIVLKKSLEKYDELLNKIEDMKNELKVLKTSYELYVTNKKKSEEAGILRKELDNLLTLEENANKQLDIIRKRQEEDLKGYDEEKYTKIKEDYENISRVVVALKQSEVHLLKDVEEGKKKLLRIGELNKLIAEKESIIKKLDKSKEIISRIRNVIKNAPLEITDVLIKSISNKASEIYTEIARDSARLEWENSYELVLYDYIGEEVIRKEFKQLSGGEQMTAALSVRIAMIELLTNLKLGILDEPTMNMDIERRERLASIVSYISYKFKQLIVVSHDDTFESITNNVIDLGGGMGE